MAKTTKSVAKKPRATKKAAVVDIQPAVEVTEKINTPLTSFSPVLCIVGSCELKVFGLSLPDRLRRQFAREGLTDEISVEVAATHTGPILLVRADAVIDQPLIAGLLKRPSFVILSAEENAKSFIAANIRAKDLNAVVALVENGIQPISGLLMRSPAEMDVGFWKALRKKETPYAMVVSKENQEAVAWRMFMGTYKGATDIVTKHLWPRPAFAVTKFLSARNVTPNMVTSVGAVMTVLAFFAFLYGYYWFGMACAWAMTFLDTVDGKLARTTLSSSKWGDIFDHGIDLVHPPFWYLAWGFGLSSWGLSLSSQVFWIVMIAIFGGYIVQRLMEGISIKWLGLEIHIWRKIDTLFRQITARRNPNLILLQLSLLIARPDWGIIAVAAWTIICLVLHGIQLVQGLQARNAEGGTLTSWMAKP
jgi:phosphatidylglycerophosphate synthase